MKVFAFISFFATAFSSFAGYSLEKFSPHFATDMPIAWQADTSHLPNGLWIYERCPGHAFSQAVISNAVILASQQSKGFPKSSLDNFYILEEHPPDYPAPIPVIFSITPKSATIAYAQPHPGTNTAAIPGDKVLIQRAWACAAELGIDRAQIEFKEMTSHFNQDEDGNEITNQLCGRGVYLSRRLDGVLFWGNGDNGDYEGFWIEFGSHGQVRAFSLVWPDLKRSKLQQTASPQQIITCIRAFKTMSPPDGNEMNYFERIKNLAKAKKLAITKITQYYGEGIYGEAPTNDDPPKIVMPIAQLEAVADFGNSNATVKLLAPILASEADMLSKPAQMR
jgi:hypothetical protein